MKNAYIWGWISFSIKEILFRMKIETIFENNRQWIAQKLELDERYFDQLAEGQSPEILYIGCSDSRVSWCFHLA